MSADFCRTGGAGGGEGFTAFLGGGVGSFLLISVYPFWRQSAGYPQALTAQGKCGPYSQYRDQYRIDYININPEPLLPSSSK
jgi:hypothetical protein